MMQLFGRLRDPPRPAVLTRGPEAAGRLLDDRGNWPQYPTVSQAPILYDFEVALAHVDRGLDARLEVRTARHPSETLERVFLRLLAFCWFHEERLAFGAGLSDHFYVERANLKDQTVAPGIFRSGSRSSSTP